MHCVGDDVIRDDVLSCIVSWVMRSLCGSDTVSLCLNVLSFSRVVDDVLSCVTSSMTCFSLLQSVHVFLNDFSSSALVRCLT